MKFKVFDRKGTCLGNLIMGIENFEPLCKIVAGLGGTCEMAPQPKGEPRGCLPPNVEKYIRAKEQGKVVEKPKITKSFRKAWNGLIQ